VARNDVRGGDVRVEVGGGRHVHERHLGKGGRQVLRSVAEGRAHRSELAPARDLGAILIRIDARKWSQTSDVRGGSDI
jgi:hypothetical protein